MTSSKSDELCFGLLLLLEAAEYNDVNMVTPPCNRKRNIATPSPPSPPAKPAYSKPAYCSLPPTKRTKFGFGVTQSRVWLGTNPRYSPSKTIKLSPVKKSSKCSGGSAHRVWEHTDEFAMATITPARHFNSWNTVEAAKEDQGVDVKVSGGVIKTFVLHDKDDDKHINAVHNIVRRDIWEGFVVNTSKDLEDEGISARRSSRLARYDGTVGFRCRYCKNAPLAHRAEKSAVYPRSLERIYLANIRFQRDHVEQCTFIPNEIKEHYSRLKSSKGISRGRKQYWVSSALRRGLCNGEKGIVFSVES
ncbi:hypothetical protein ACHAXR_006901 [Thalassiosira sp. AJA248-18]